MTDQPEPPHLFSELRRRKVFRTAAAYLAGAFVLLQVADLTFEPLGLPASAYRALIIVAAAGFPVALVISWFFDLRVDNLRPRAGRRAAIALGVFVLVCTSAMAYGIARHWQRADYDTTSTIAVLPFKVMGSTELAYLESGLVEMVSRNIDGAGRLRAIAPDMVLTYASGKNTPLAELAEKLAAPYLVSGSVTQVGDQVRVTATLQDYRKENAAPVTRVVEGKTSEVFGLVDQLSAQILSATRSGQDARLTESAALTTRSLPALRKYLTGEDYFRRTVYDSAITHFTDAVTLDSTFALAYYRLANAHLGAGQAFEARKAGDNAVRHSGRLAARDRALVDAWATLAIGKWEEAEAKYRAILQQYPGDMEATFQLAETTLYNNAFSGEPVAEAEPLFAQVEAADPEFLCPI
jgi:TolB-like protein